MALLSFWTFILKKLPLTQTHVGPPCHRNPQSATMVVQETRGLPQAVAYSGQDLCIDDCYGEGRP